MSLDTVELIVAFEKHFQISIPDPEAEKIATVGEAAACITRLKGLSPDPARTAVYYVLLQKLLGCLQVVHQSAAANTLLATVWSTGAINKTTTLATCLKLEVPTLPKFTRPQQSGPTPWWQRLFGHNYKVSHPPDWSACTVANFADWIVAQNYAVLLPAPATLYEAQRVAVGLTSYYSGIDVPEIQLTDSFTNDLGMD